MFACDKDDECKNVFKETNEKCMEHNEVVSEMMDDGVGEYAMFPDDTVVKSHQCLKKYKGRNDKWDSVWECHNACYGFDEEGMPVTKQKDGEVEEEKKESEKVEL